VSVPVIARDEVHLWQCVTDPAHHEHDLHAGCFEPGEEAQRRSLRFKTEGLRFRQARWARRIILAMYAGCAPRELAFADAPGGKPFVSAPSASCPLSFSASRSGNLILIAVAEGLEIGVDVERLHGRDVWAPIVRSMLAETEASALLQLAEPTASRAFVSLWTRREALLKALGWGLRFGLDAVSVGFSPSSGQAPLVETAVADERSWSVRNVAVQPGYAAALACEGDMRRVRSFMYRRCDTSMSDVCTANGKEVPSSSRG
jgi:4'-phosphopantetheinyl transferase